MRSSGIAPWRDRVSVSFDFSQNSSFTFSHFLTCPSLVRVRHARRGRQVKQCSRLGLQTCSCSQESNSVQQSRWDGQLLLELWVQLDNCFSAARRAARTSSQGACPQGSGPRCSSSTCSASLAGGSTSWRTGSEIASSGCAWWSCSGCAGTGALCSRASPLRLSGATRSHLYPRSRSANCTCRNCKKKIEKKSRSLNLTVSKPGSNHLNYVTVKCWLLDNVLTLHLADKLLDALASLETMLVIKSVINVFEIWQRFKQLSRLLRLLSWLVVKVCRRSWSSRLVAKVVCQVWSSRLVVKAGHQGWSSSLSSGLLSRLL